MDQSPNSPHSMGSFFSSPAAETLHSTIDPPPSVTGSTQDPQAPNPNPNSSQIEEPPSSDTGSDKDAKDPIEAEGEEEEEEAECGFCLFMKGGGCKDSFVAWEKCVEDAEKGGEDIAEKCFEVTSTLKKCMDAHADYYEPILNAEKAMADSITEEAEAEKAEKDSDAEKGTWEPKEEAKVAVITVTDS